MVALHHYLGRMQRLNVHRIAIITTCILALGIAVGTLLPPETLPHEPPGSDKLHHFIAFAALVFPAVAANPKYALWVLPMAIVYGGVIELIQPSFGRGAEWGDFFADTLGAFTGAGAGWLVHTRFIRPRLNRPVAVRSSSRGG